MRKAILSSILLASSIACTGCGSGGDGNTSGTGGSGGPGTAYSFDATSSLPAMGATAAVVVVATQFSNGVSAILEILDTAPEAASLGVTSKQHSSAEFCPGGGVAHLTGLPAGDLQAIVPPLLITLDLEACVGSAFAAAPASGNVTLTISSVNDPGGTVGPTIDGSATVELSIEPDTSITGTFDVSARVSLGFLQNGRILLRLGAQGDQDLITVSEAGQVLRLACFDIDVGLSNVESDYVSPLGVADLSGQVYTVNNYEMTPPSIIFGDDGVPTSGELTLVSGDQSAASAERSGACAEFEGIPEGNESFVTATFFEGGCIDLQPFQTSTTWAKLLDRDFTSGSDGACGSSMPCGEVPLGATVIEDSDFADSNWMAETVATEGAVFDAPIVQEASGGLGDSAFRRMTHSIENAENCAESCTVGVVHTIATKYDPSADGAIAFINYTEAQKVITPGFDGAAVGWAFAVVQDERRFNGPSTTAFTVTGWTTNGLCGLTQDDFGPADGPHPDFSASGGELSFAYIRTNTNTSEVAAITNVHGIDDFEVVIVKE